MRAMRLSGHACCLLLLALGCESPRLDVLAELPPPRLASLSPQEDSTQLHRVGPGSRAQVTLGPRKSRARLQADRIRGWVKTTRDGRFAVAGDLAVELASLEPSPSESGADSSELLGLGPLTASAEEIRLVWPAAGEPVPTGAGAVADARTSLTLNRHRSELRPQWRLKRAKGGKLSASMGSPAKLSLADHGLRLRLRSSSGLEQIVDLAKLQLLLELTPAADADEALSPLNSMD